MRLVRTVRGILEDRGVRYVLIGAHAAAFYGVIRSTRDIDLFTVDGSVLNADVWSEADAHVTILTGDVFDPLAGTVRLIRDREQVDVVVGKWKFELAIIERSESRPFDDAMILVPRPADVILLKIAAGGPQDMWDIHELLQYVDRESVMAEVDAEVGALPSDARVLWKRVRAELSGGGPNDSGVR